MWKPDYGRGSESEDAQNSQVDSESLLKEIQRLYTERAIGLRDTARSLTQSNLKFKIVVPQQKITVLMVGHHTVAKQKFLDLYFDDPRQGSFITKVDYEKLDRVFITQGDRRKWLSGETVLDYCPHLEKLRNVPGLQQYLTTEIAARQRKSLVSFILAPETRPEEEVSLTTIKPAIRGSRAMDINNNVNSPSQTQMNEAEPERFRLDQAIGTLASAADLIFMFFDPTGQVSPKATLKPFNSLWENHHEKLHLLLAKADYDESTDEIREDILADIVRDVWRIPQVKKVGYLPQIYCPDLTSRSKDDERLWKIIQTAAKQSVERALKQLDKDSHKLRMVLEARRRRNIKAKSNATAPLSSYLWAIMFICILGGFAVSQVNDFWCTLQGGNFKAICSDLMRSEIFVSIVGLLVTLYIVYTLYVEKDDVQMTPSEEDLLEKRINFVNFAVEQKKSIEAKSKRLGRTSSVWNQSIFSSKSSIY